MVIFTEANSDGVRSNMAHTVSKLTLRYIVRGPTAMIQETFKYNLLMSLMATPSKGLFSKFNLKVVPIKLIFYSKKSQNI